MNDECILPQSPPRRIKKHKRVFTQHETVVLRQAVAICAGVWNDDDNGLRTLRALLAEAEDDE